LRKDSLDINDDDRELVKEKLEKVESERIIITH